MKHLTETTGTVTGKEEVKNFIEMCKVKFNKVYFVDSPIKTDDYLQYTLLTNNEIRLFY